ncbi:PepSY domain-containing protein [Marinicaulis aureus]|uniref:PepSY domain-containing protein n=1 Tax=Hyphococcus aureus TaxID=2666033 RepID=A0ABW1L3V3_9PROT
MKAKTWVQRIHLWAGLILGIQVLLWMASGVIMSWFPIEMVRGENVAFISPPIELEAQAYASPGGIIAQAAGATSVELKRFGGRVVYLASNADGAIAMFDASSGERLTPLKERDVRGIAKQDFVGDGEIVSARLISFPPQEYRRETPVWRVDFDDKYNTRLYISPSSGEVRARRNDIWRLYDFFWMLHIMDYEDREDFNNPLVMTAAAAGLVFALSGIIIVIMRLTRGRYKHDLMLLARAKPRKRDAPSKKTEISDGSETRD